MTADRIRDVRNFFGGLFLGYAFASFAAGIIFYGMYAPEAPTAPIGDHIYRVRQYGTWFTAGQNASLLLLTLSIAFAIPGHYLRPTQPITVLNFREKRPKYDDPRKLARWGMLVGVAILALVLVGPGPWLIRAIAQAGVLLPPL